MPSSDFVPDESPETGEEWRPIFAIFEGGGAKGVAHVGAMKAAEENGFGFAATAGASAGAVVATLIAAGFGADQIFDPERPNDNILRRYGKTPIDLFCRVRWRRFTQFRRGMLWVFVPLFFAGWLASCLLAWRRSCVVWDIFENHGYFSTDEIRDLINRVLRDRLFDVYAAYSNYGSDWNVPERVTFGHLDYATFGGEFLPLKIVATNMRTGNLEIFERNRTPTVEVADAVVASIAIPLVFKPVVMRSNPSEGPYLDGGLVSNLPTWVFAEEKLMWERDYPDDPPIPIVGFSLAEPSRDTRPKSRLATALEFFARVARTALSGSQIVSHQFVEDLKVVKVETAFGLLDFDKPQSDFVQAYRDGKRHAEETLRTSLIKKPNEMRRDLRKLLGEITAEIDARRNLMGLAPLSHCRACFIERVAPYTLRVRYTLNMENDADDRLILDSRGGGAAEAFRTRAPTFISFPAGQPIELMRKYERALVRPSLQGAVCIPIFESDDEWAKLPAEARNEPLGVFCFDSDEDLKTHYNDDSFKEFVVKRSTLLRDAIKFGKTNV